MSTLLLPAVGRLPASQAQAWQDLCPLQRLELHDAGIYSMHVHESNLVATGSKVGGAPPLRAPPVPLPLSRLRAPHAPLPLLLPGLLQDASVGVSRLTPAGLLLERCPPPTYAAPLS